MKITQLRNASIVIEFEHQGRAEVILVDPMLAAKGALPSLKYLGGSRRRNPLVELPPNSPELLSRVTRGLITHCQRGHFDHLDRAGKRFLRERKTPVTCMPDDRAYLAERGLAVEPLLGNQRQAFLGGHITPIACVHARGWIGRFMAHGHGYFIELPHEPSLYIAGDTLLTDEVARCLRELQPAVTVLPAGGARFDVGSEILMNEHDIYRACQLTQGVVIANHLEALDHCPTARSTLRAAAEQLGLSQRLLVPNDGQTLCFSN